jgi:hypothetical protein
MNKWIAASITTIIVIIIFVVVKDYLSLRTDNRPANPYAYNIDEFATVEDTLVSYREARQIRISGAIARDIVWHNGKIFLLTDQYIQVLSPQGQELQKISTESEPLCVTVSGNDVIFVGHENFIIGYNRDGNIIAQTNLLPDNALISSLAASETALYAADAGTKTVRIFDHALNQTGEFKGESGASDIHGFILPGMQFHLAINQTGELWVTNPGIHAIQNYSETGRLRGYWRKASFGTDGFSGCCNPSFIAFLSDDSFVTSEKGLIRIKIHHPSGEFITMVAAPERFKNGSHAPAIAVDDNDNIIALDFDRNLIRFFIKKTS